MSNVWLRLSLQEAEEKACREAEEAAAEAARQEVCSPRAQ